MIYVAWLFLVLFTGSLFYSFWLSIKVKGKEYLLWIAASIVFGDIALDIAKDIKTYYEEQPAVKEVRV